ncbi:VOC family protein [Novosphingobium album (ex Liu et al. 2023)]|uniref:VOC family protein n=1 Tax=Novosphingobium album (ex Liu et al. 2023) TaxID=3031130 RepID=A0ABT5WV76_9SPHN|nr:VOC family protein [Novosphingobium album (ex Liu et al. 2023)]MDE8653766.1 VOC family protein [Novosphingobium album (ex Liu et al. 2023)]
MSGLGEAQAISFVLTADRARAWPFYAETLGLPVIAQDDFAVTFALAGGAILRLTDLPGHAAQDHTVLGWSVPDIRAAAADLRARGVTFRIYEGFGQDADGIWEAPGGGAKVAWFCDTDGNVLSLTEF